MLDVFWGEFLTSPIPLELSLNVCSGGCVYCFANLNKPDRRANIEGALRLLRDKDTRKSWAARLLREGYPVLISNRSDAFSKNNYARAVPLLRVMHDMGVPMAFQTRGGWGIDDALDFLRPACWYITIETLDDELARRLSPGTPPPSARLALMRKLTERGHAVVLGFNPCVPEWQPEPEPLLQAAKAAGAWGVWIESLHFDHRQAGRVSDAGRAVMGDDLIARVQKRRPAPEDSAAFYAARDCARSIGLEIFSVGQPCRSEFWQPWRSLYPRLFPVMQDFINDCHDSMEQGAVFDFDHMAAALLPLLPEGIGPLDSYLGSVAHQLWKTHKIPTTMTFEQLLAIAWAEPRVRFCPARLPAFAYAAHRGEDGEWSQYGDERGLPYLVFSGGDEWMFWHYSLEGE